MSVTITDTTPQQRAVATILVAAGSGSRAGLPEPKQYSRFRHTTVLGFAVQRLREAIPGPIVVVVPPDDEGRARKAIGDDWDELFFTAGGATRQESVRAGLKHLGEVGRTTTLVLIHDAARPDVRPDVVARLLARLSDVHGAIPVLPVTDSLIVAELDNMHEAVPREKLFRVQTPQAFVTGFLNAAHKEWKGSPTATDDAQVLRAAGMEVALVEGDEALHKLTYAADFADAVPIRVGTGYDVHRLAAGEELWLCGVHIPHSHGLSGHSDADVAIHALVDAILGAIGQGDIGNHFPPSDPQWRGASSDRFLAHAVSLAAEAGYRIGNVDLTIICEAPKIGPHRDAMRARLAALLDSPIAAVSVKATTTERLGFTGRGEGIACQAAATLLAN